MADRCCIWDVIEPAQSFRAWSLSGYVGKEEGRCTLQPAYRGMDFPSPPNSPVCLWGTDHLGYHCQNTYQRPAALAVMYSVPPLSSLACCLYQTQSQPKNISARATDNGKHHRLTHSLPTRTRLPSRR